MQSEIVREWLTYKEAEQLVGLSRTTLSSSTPQGLSASSTGHCVSPVNKLSGPCLSERFHAHSSLNVWMKCLRQEECCRLIGGDPDRHGLLTLNVSLLCFVCDHFSGREVRRGRK